VRQIIGRIGNILLEMKRIAKDRENLKMGAHTIRLKGCKGKGNYVEG
jgi:hypothetical protein